MPSIQRVVRKSLGATIGLALEPVITGSALAALRFLPENLKRQILDANPFGTKDEKPKLLLLILFVVGVLRRANKALSAAATNNWRVAPQEEWKWDEEVAVVTGGCNGIGKQIVLALAKGGVRVAVLDVQEFPADLQTNAAVSYFRCDVTSATAVDEAVAAVRATLGEPSILVNNAGVAQRHSILDTPDEFLHTIMGVNLMALWRTTKACLPGMIARNKGHIVTIASVASFIALPSAADYSAAKAGALAFHETLGCEIKHLYKAPGIVTTVVHPSWVRTNMTEPHRKQIEKSSSMMAPEYVAKRVAEQIFNRRGGQLVIPSSLSVVLPSIRGWPSWLQELVRDGAGRMVSSRS